MLKDILYVMENNVEMYKSVVFQFLIYVLTLKSWI